MKRSRQSFKRKSVSDLGKVGMDGIRCAGRITDSAATGLFRWATTDHTGFSQAMANKPEMGFVDSVIYALTWAAASILSAIFIGVGIFFIIGYVIPFLLMGHL